MKKRSFILLVLMMIFSVFCLVGCGAQGPQGEKGDKGDQGVTGDKGPQGEKGDKGQTGKPGEQGIQGEKGDKGDKGDAGIDGREVQFIMDKEGLKWRYVGEGDDAWRLLMGIKDLHGYSNTYEVKFDVAGGSEVKGLENVLYNSEVELPTPEKEGLYFLGWYDANAEEKEYLNGKVTISENMALTAEWAYEVTLDLNGGEIVGTYLTVEEMKEAWVADYNAWGGTSYTTNSSFLWHGELFKFFQDATYGPKWSGLLQYFIDTETAYYNYLINDVFGSKEALDEQMKKPAFDLYESFEGLAKGEDLTKAPHNKDVSPYCITYSLNSWMHNKQQGMGTPGDLTSFGANDWHFCANYSTDEIQNKALDYYAPSKETTRYVIAGEKEVLPDKVAKGDLNFLGWYDEEGNKVDSYNFVPAAKTALKATFGGEVTLNANVDDVDPLLKDLEATTILVGEADAAVKLPVLERNHYDFLGWFDAAGNQVTEVSNTTTVSSVKAKWQGNIYTLTYVGTDNELDPVIIVYGNELGTLDEGTKEGMVFDGWFTTETFKEGTEATADIIVRGDMTVYAKFKQPYTVKLNYGETLGQLNDVRDASVAFLTDFYNWCLAQNAFTAAEMTKEAFIGYDETNKVYTCNGLWVNYSGAAGNPNTFFAGYSAEDMKNFFMAPKAEKETDRQCGVIENSTYFLNDADMNAKWGPYMAAIKKVCNDASRCWGDAATNYFIYEVSRALLADDAAFKSSYGQTNVDLRNAKTPIEGCEHLLFSKHTEAREYTVFSLTSDNKLPEAYKEGYVFVGWTDAEKGGRPYTHVIAEELHGKTLKPVFVEIKEQADFVIKYASSRQPANCKLSDLGLTNNTYANGEPWPSAVFRDKIMLKYNAEGKLEVVCTDLNGVRITTDSTKSYYVEGKSNLEFDLVIIGYAAEADAAIKALNLQVGDIIEFAAANNVYDVLDGADPENWKPDHAVEIKAYITRKVAETPAA